MNKFDQTKLVQALKEIVNPKAVIPVSSPLKLCEERNFKNDKKCRFVELKGLEGQNFIFKLDAEELGQISNYFNPQTKGINRACDAVLFTLIKEMQYIFFIELKSGNIKGAKEQLQNAELFVSYLGSILKEYKHIDIKGFKKRFFIFCTDVTHHNPTSNRAKIKPREEKGRKIFICNCNERIWIKKFDLS